MFIYSKLRLLWQRSKANIDEIRLRYADSAARKFVFNNQSFVRFLSSNLHDCHQKKQTFLHSISGKRKTVFYVFRDLHLVDWFLPIHVALDKYFPGKFAVLYINFGSTLKKVGSGFGYLPYLNDIEKRLSAIPDAGSQHFSDQEISLFTGFPKPDIVLTTETIRKEKFESNHRVYLPHYTVPKANEGLPAKIRYNHVFLPTKPKYSYPVADDPQKEGVQLHQIGYPKMFSVSPKRVSKFKNSHPVVIFAPSLDIVLIQSMIKEGILEVFKRLENINVIIKLHPTLSSKMHYLNHFLIKEIKSYPHIVIDTKTNIQELAPSSSLMITDFGSIGAEYRLGFGKRLIYLKIPRSFEGGADLCFRDHFADAVTSVEQLEVHLKSIIAGGDLNTNEIETMKEEVLYNWQNADRVAAEKIAEILSV